MAASLYLIFSFSESYTQINIRSQAISNTIWGIQDVYFLIIDNTFPQSVQVQLKVVINTGKKDKIAEGLSGPILLQTGSTVLNADLHAMMNFTYGTSNDAKKLAATRYFTPGEYKVCYSLINVTDQTEIGEYCMDFTVDKNTSHVQSGSPLPAQKSNSKVQFNGTSELLFNYSTTQSNYTAMPPTYLNWIVNPQLTVYDIPVSGRLFLSTAQMEGQQNMNAFTIQFDAQQYKEILKKKLIDSFQKNNLMKEVGIDKAGNYLKEIENIQGILKNPGVANELTQLKQLDSLKSLCSSIKKEYKINDFSTAKSVVIHGETSDSLRTNAQGNFMEEGMSKTDSIFNQFKNWVDHKKEEGIKKLDSLKSKIKALEWLEEKRTYYNQLMAKKEQVENAAKQMGLVDSAGNIISADKLSEKLQTERLTDPDYLFSKLRSSKLLRKVDKVLYAVKRFSIGMSTPLFSDLSLNGMAVNGITTELEMYSVYAGFTHGEILNPVLSLIPSHASYKRTITGGKFGYGRKDKSHIHVTILSSRDDTASITPRDSLYLYIKKPQDNKVISIEGQLNLFKNKLKIYAEFSGSQTIKDITTFTDNVIWNNDPLVQPDNWFVNILTQRNNVAHATVDYAINARIEALLFKDKTNISASFRRVGPEYYSFGLPFLIRDMMTFEIKASQRLWKNRIQISGFLRRNNDNLENTKYTTTSFYTYGLDFSLKVPKWPSLRTQIMPITLQNDSSYFNLISFNATSTYQFKLKKVINLTALSIMHQFSAATDSLHRFQVTNINLNYTLQIKKGPSVQLNTGYFNSITPVQATKTWIVGAGTGVTFFKIWNNLLGGNLYINERELRWGIYYQTNISILKHLTCSIRLENNQFNTYAWYPGMVDFSQFTCRTLLTARW